MTQIRVLHFSPSPHSSGGIAQYSQRYREAINKFTDVDIRPFVVSESEVDGDAVYRSLCSQLLSTPVHLVHAELGFGTHLVFATLARLLRRRSVSVIATLHDPPRVVASPALPLFRYRASGLISKVIRKGLIDPVLNKTSVPSTVSLVSELVVLNKAAVEPTRRRFPSVRVEYVPILAPDSVQGPTSSRGSPFTVAFYGNIGPGKRIELLLSSVADLVKTGVDIRILIVGGTLSNDYEALLRKLSGRGVLRGRVTFTGHKPYEELERIMRNVDLAVLPYADNRRLGASGAAIDCMSWGVPLLVPDLPRFIGEFRENEEIFTFDHLHPGSLGVVIDSLIHNPPRLSSTSVRAARRVRDMHSAATIAARMQSIYQGILRPPGGEWVS